VQDLGILNPARHLPDQQVMPDGIEVGRLEEGVEVLVDHAVQHRVLGVARPVVADAARHSGDIGAPRERPQCPAMDSPQRWAAPREGPRLLGARGDTSSASY
jgi:hypothetical protein